MMQPPPNGNVGQGIRQTTPQQQLQLPPQAAQNLRATPPRPSLNNSPTTSHFTGVTGTAAANLQPLLQIIQQNNPQLSVADATKVAIEHLGRIQQESLRGVGTNGILQHLPAKPMVKSSPTQANQQIRRSPSQNPGTPVAQGQQRI